jgi:NAD(P)-dependent dehydrogenase (short-subunit alcohol dehydrogenase family)
MNETSGQRPEPRQVIVTGVSSGIGKAIAIRLLEQGCRVVGMARSVNEQTILHECFVPLPVDLARLESLPGLLLACAETYPDVDAVICCAGKGRFAGLEEFSYAQIREIIDLNFTSQAYLIKTFLPKMKRAGHGDIIIIGSEAALAGARKGSVYCAGKFALRGMAQALRDECSKSGIRVTIINPGMVKTPFFDSLNFEPGESPQNYVLPQDVADAVALVLNARPETVFDEINLSPLKKVVRSKPSRES